MEIFSNGTEVVTVPLFQDRTKSETVTWQTCGKFQRRFPKNGRDSQRLFFKVKVFSQDRLGFFP